ncbi:MAG TPA: DNA-processing protein DprA [Jiangellales bacterium]|nr:DNA-processing protein DprA [Jiangellales bacterium]
MIGPGERRARAALAVAVEAGTPGVSAAVAEHGAEAVLAGLRGRRPETPGGAAARARARRVDGAEVLAEAGRVGLRLACPGDPEWPSRLDDLDLREPREGVGGVPLGLWVAGHHDLAEVAERSVSVVGARACTSYGTEVAGDLAAGLADRGWAVVSGGAYGIDAAAHRGALVARGVTVAVLACGADQAYPRGNAALLSRIAADGLVVAELPPGAHPTRARFLARNRLIAALSTGTAVVEAAARSGALSTLRWAGHLDRVLMAVPGPVTSALSVGAHVALRDGAHLVTGSADVLDLVGSLSLDAAPTPRGPERPWDGLPATARTVLEALPSRGTRTVEDLSRRTGLPDADVRAELARLRLDDLADRDLEGWRLGRAAREARAAERAAARAAADESEAGHRVAGAPPVVGP